MSAIRYTGSGYAITQVFYDRVDLEFGGQKKQSYDSIEDLIEDNDDVLSEDEIDEILAVFSDPHFDDPKALAADDRRDRMKDGEL